MVGSLLYLTSRLPHLQPDSLRAGTQVSCLPQREGGTQQAPRAHLLTGHFTGFTCHFLGLSVPLESLATVWNGCVTYWSDAESHGKQVIIWASELSPRKPYHHSKQDEQPTSLLGSSNLGANIN